MSRTIGRHWPKSAPRGDYSARCDECGVLFRRSQLMRRPEGTLACIGPGTNNDGAGLSGMELDQLNVASQTRSETPPADGGSIDEQVYTP